MSIPGNGFAAKVLIILLGVLFSALLGFFIWLATTIIDIRERVVRIEVTAQTLAESRQRQLEQRAQHNSDRLDQLESNPAGDIQGNRR